MLQRLTNLRSAGTHCSSQTACLLKVVRLPLQLAAIFLYPFRAFLIVLFLKHRELLLRSTARRKIGVLGFAAFIIESAKAFLAGLTERMGVPTPAALRKRLETMRDGEQKGNGEI